ncbi:ATP-dependent DNA helicase PIF1 [Paramuricea clavata]|uniref:ATP-dependent DNA helicase n=1 Tax=Paramuricea clavata TaxID=317549 RepID=A0A6S7IL64_PARCT|nr:ATP-dependent DNA helicase PIF1 [Paramuricea clavata]
MESPIRLTEEQQTIFDLAKKGYNICILGRASVGKSTTVQEIKKELSAKCLQCEIICSTGIACKNYDGEAKTSHSFYGLQIAELPSEMLAEGSLTQEKIRKRLGETNVLIWDEVSMTSKRILELVNIIHLLLSNNNFAFGGIQVILVGDFWHLKPIPSVFDNGKAIYESHIFNEVFQHRIELTKILRQSECETSFKDLLEMLRKIHEEHDNGTVLASLPGELIQYQSIDTGHTTSLEKSIPRVLAVKPGCKIMLLCNINDNLKNGYQGEFIGSDPDDENKVIVNFPTTGTVSLSRRTWFKYARDGKVQGSRTQFPILRCYAITVHKSQSLTLEAAVGHCAQEFVHGQTYVAMSRVKLSDKLQVINFHRKFLLPPPPELVNLARNVTCLEPTETYACCKYRPLYKSHFVAGDSVMMFQEEIQSIESDKDETDVTDESHETFEGEEFFKTTEGTATCKLEDVLLCLIPHFETELSTPLSTFTMETFLTSATTNRTDQCCGEICHQQYGAWAVRKCLNKG